ncbi:thiamine phosphate synthase [Zhengella mangrovi]|uniref:Thiamine phosphate synthase n=1 Tax=Zhengella mangrovi TaxID=1982044 RepID=A0A2G1QKY1_9HYPH|nr:thiamine phosphate synthase [Zhengella mangrovi]PHP66124.1 thiamine phosphate synthase [Zhengella mangrovi]
MPHATPDTRCRLVLIAPDIAADDAFAAAVSRALSGGDVASLILPAYDLPEAAFQARCAHIVPQAQERGVAVMIVDDTRTAGRVRADGVHLENAKAAIAETAERFDGKLMLGVGGAKTRHDALELGEVRPDYIFFGRIGYDTKPEAHPRNLALGEWWAEMVTLPCIVMGGSSIESTAAVAATRADFVAMSAAVFGGPLDPGEAVAAINRMLDETAPELDAA